ncbi:MAG TPA: hypothetical protein VGC72_01995 [Candidatus Elarobacter sp.]|jgi:hypothetical protein
MKLSLPVLALLMATGLPLAACAQQSNAAEKQAPSPEIRAQMQAARDSAKTAAFNDLSAANRAKVQSIVDQINNGQLTDVRAAAQQIDAVLTPAETKAVLGERDKLMQTMRANMPPRPDGAPGGPNGPPPNAAPNAAPNAGPNGAPNGDQPRRGGFGRMNDAGGFLISLGVSREKMRELRRSQMQQGQPQRPPGQ